MSLPIQNSRAGTCPHGCPLGACPICNGMSGGGMTKRNEPAKKREMSWSECYAIWQKMLAKQAEKKQDKDIFQNNQNSLQNQDVSTNRNIKTVMNTVSVNLNFNKTNIKTNKNVFLNIKNFAVNVLLKTGNTAIKLAKFIKETVVNIMDKLTAIFGEAKNFIEKKILDNLKNLPKKLFKLFGLYEVENEDEDEKRIEEEKRALEQKKIKETFIHSANGEGLEDDEN